MAKKKLIDSRCICRCCGYSFGNYFPWGEDGMSPEYDICDCCGCIVGNDDYCLDSLLEYRQQWIDSNAKWYNTKKRPVYWDNGKQLSKQLDRVLPKIQLHRFDDGVPILGESFDTPEAAIIGGELTDINRKKELGLSIESIRGLTVRNFRWSPNRLILTFDEESLVLESKLIEIQIFVSSNSIPAEPSDQTIYEIEYSSDLTSTWNPTLIATKFEFVGKKFMNIQLTHRIVWLYFNKSPLIQVVHSPVREFSLPILHWDEGV